jgi:arylsulfatase A-like enzyme
MTTERIHRSNPGRNAAYLSATLALFFLFLERLKDSRSSFWCPMTWRESLGAVLTFLIFWAFLAIASALTGALLRSVRVRTPGLALSLSGLGAGLALWAFLSVFRTRTPTMDDALVVGTVVTLTVLSAVLQWSGVLRLGNSCLVWSLAFLSGIAAQRAALDWFFFEPRRVALVTGLSSLWLVVVLGAGTAVWVATRGRRLAVVPRILAGVLALAVPVAFWIATSSPLRNGWSETGGGEGSRNLLFLTCDALGADYCATYGGTVPTPAFDRVAQDGALFLQSYSLAPWTLPSMNAMFLSAYPTGLTPGGSRTVWRKELTYYEFDPATPTLAEQLAAKGYVTAAFVGNPILRDRDGILRGFHHTVDFEPHAPEKRGPFARSPFLWDAVAALVPGLVSEGPRDLARLLNVYATTFVRQNARRPFFLWVHHIDPHEPYDPPAAFRTQTGPWPSFCPIGQHWDTPKLDDFGNITVSETDKAYVRSLYEGEIQYVDFRLGELLCELGSLGLADETYVCITADHGEEFWEHGRYGHGQSAYNDLVRVPLAFAGPGLVHQTVETPVSAIDLMPTFAELMGLAPAPEWRGYSLVPLLKGEPDARPPRPCFAQATSHYCWPQPLQMVTDGRAKLIREPGTGRVELYDLEADPHETTDLAASDGSEAGRLTALLDAWAGSFPVTFAERTADSDAARQQEVEDRLRSIGYID